jgi:hypothetical protein
MGKTLRIEIGYSKETIEAIRNSIVMFVDTLPNIISRDHKVGYGVVEKAIESFSNALKVDTINVNVGQLATLDSTGGGTIIQTPDEDSVVNTIKQALRNREITANDIF